ncbi:MAG: lipid-binding SYLF domain-containing protein [Ulvibacter sp.]|jgi:lipid-binding SYLF domain-containing protein
MKNKIMKLGTLVAFALITMTSIAKTKAIDNDLTKESKAVLQEMIDNSWVLQSLHDQSYGYAVFPKVTKAGIWLGGAASTGVVFEKQQVVGTTKLKQLSFGAQLGGQQYSEIIFFENKVAFDRFMNNKLKLGAQASAVALKSGTSIDVSYSKGVAIFTQPIKGLMYEASVGGQHFSTSAIND